MTWNYSPTSSPITHPAGTVPDRPLMPGDSILWLSDDHTERVERITATSPGLLHTITATGSTAINHRAPIQGDFSACITEVPAAAPADAEPARPTLKDEAERLLGYWETHGENTDVVAKWAVTDMLGILRYILEDED